MSLEQAEAAVLAEMKKERRRRRTAQGLGVLATSMGALALLLMAQRETAHRSLVLGLSAIPTLLLLMKPRRWVLVSGLALSAAMTLIAASASGLDPDAGLHCLLTEIASAILPVAAAAIAARINRDPIRLVQTALLSSVAMQGILFSVCRAHDKTAHLVAFHNGGIVFVLVLAIATERLLTDRTA